MEDMLGDALKAIFGPLKNLMEQLQGEKRELWLQVLRQLSRMKPETVLIKLNQPPFPLWKNIQVGDLCLNPSQIIEKFTAEGIGPNFRFPLILSLSEYQKGIYAESKSVAFVKGSLYDLFGFQDYTHHDVFLNSEFLAQYGLELCKAADAIYIRLAWKNQGSDENTFVGIKPYYYTRKKQPEGLLYPTIPRLSAAAGKLWFGEDWRHEGKWHSASVWIFRRKKIQP